MDYQGALYDPIYLIQGVPCVLTLADSRVFDAFTALDKTTGIDVGDEIETPTLRPVAAFRMRELRAEGITPADTVNATLEINEYVWTVRNYKMRPSPRGENDGEVYLILTDGEAVVSESESESEA